MFFTAFAFAETTSLCPRPDAEDAYVDSTLAPTGEAWVLVREGDLTCFWVVDDRDEGQVRGRWEEDGPVAIEALEPATVVLAFPEGKLQFREQSGARQNVRFVPDGRVRGLLGHPDMPYVAILGDHGAQVVDMDRGAVVTTLRVPAGAGLSFVSGDSELRVDLSGLRRSRR